MADGRINEFFDIPALDKQIALVDGKVRQLYKDLAAAAVSTSAGGTSVKGAGGAQAQKAAQDALNQSNQKATKVLKELTIEEAKQNELIRQKNLRTKEAVNLEEGIVGAYKAHVTLTGQLRKQYLDLATAQGMSSKATKEAYETWRKADTQLRTLDRSVKDFRSNVGNYTSAFDKIKSSWVGITAAWAAATTAGAGLLAFMKASVQGALDDERAQRRLFNALNSNTAAYERMMRFKDRLMKSTLFSEEEIMGAINMGTEMGRTEAQTRKLVETAMGLSRLTGTDLNTQMLALSATYEGQTGRLGKLSSDVKGLTDAQLRNGEAVDILNKKYGKLASEGLQSTEGQILQAKKWWGETMDEIGFKFITFAQGIQTGFRVISAVMGGGVSKRSTEQTRLAGQRQQIKDIQDNIAAMRAVPQATEKVAQAKIKEADSVGKVANAWDDYVASMILAQRVQENFVGPTATFGQAGASKGVRAPSIGIMGKQAAPSMTAVPNPSPETPSLDKYTMGDLALDAANWNSKIQIAADATAKIDQIVSASFQNRMAMLDQEAAKDEANKEKELAAAGNNRAKIDEINKRYAAKEKEREKERRRLEVEQAKYKKTSGIIQAIINTALGVTQMLANPGGVLGIVLAALAAATGAAEVAIIASQPVPAYAKGRKGGPAEFALVGEKGTEAIVTKDGVTMTPATSTLAYLPQGAHVIPNHELQDMVGRSSMFMPTYSNSTLRDENETLRAGFFMLKNAIENKKEFHLDINERGFAVAVRNGETWHRYVNNHIRL